ncbi:MAG: RHS repeat-associated core domain-containing protein [Bacteroidales bacterium]|nr:RHS repeat-associated core domain-containing protein [Bacteroidales bacterium]
MYDEQGRKTWEAGLDIYGKVLNLAAGSLNDCPFRYQGQYEDEEIGLYYNRFRYYSPDIGTYVSQDPIRLAGKMPNMYSYVHDGSVWADPLGLTPWGDIENFGNWFDNASVQDIVDNKKSVENALRAPGGKHEMFPVSQATKAKELGFTHAELMEMTVKTNEIEFVDVPDRKGFLHTGRHVSSGVPNNPASSNFHKRLINDLKGAKNKREAKDIVYKHHNKHMKIKPCQ